MNKTTHQRRVQLQKFILALRTADTEAFEDGDWERLERIRLVLADSIKELDSLKD
jgi:hypothetical protein